MEKVRHAVGVMEGDLLAKLSKGLERGSASFIVTVYGDVVVPRGGVLWTGSLIEIWQITDKSADPFLRSLVVHLAARKLAASYAASAVPVGDDLREDRQGRLLGAASAQIQSDRRAHAHRGWPGIRRARGRRQRCRA